MSEETPQIPMADINHRTLIAEAVQTLASINQQIQAFRQDMESQAERHGWEDWDIYKVRNTDGTYVLVALLAAKAQCLQTIALAKADRHRSIIDQHRLARQRMTHEEQQ